MEQKPDGKTIAFIPLRGGSKTILLKNIREIAGRPLAYWTIDAACGCALIDRVFVSTDSPRIAEVINGYGNPKVEVISRSDLSSTDTAPTESALLEFAENQEFWRIVLVQATSPLLEASHLTGGIEKLINSGAESLVSTVRQKRFIWKELEDGTAIPTNYDPLQRPRRQDWQGVLVENGAFYITTRLALLKSRCRISGKTVFYEMPENTYYELDDPSDWTVMEALLQKRRKEDRGALSERLKRIKLLAMDIDGVLTDAGMYYGEGGDELKKFNTRDGKGIELVRALGIKIAFITSENTELAMRRSEKLKIDFLIQGVSDKAVALKDLMERCGFISENVAYIGDDINDTEAMRLCGFSATPSDGVRQNRAAADYICEKKGGEGCVREVCDIIMESVKT